MFQVGVPENSVQLDVPELSRGRIGDDIMHHGRQALAVDGVGGQRLAQDRCAQLTEIRQCHKSIISRRMRRATRAAY